MNALPIRCSQSLNPNSDHLTQVIAAAGMSVTASGGVYCWCTFMHESSVSWPLILILLCTGSKMAIFLYLFFHVGFIIISFHKRKKIIVYEFLVFILIHCIMSIKKLLCWCAYCWVDISWNLQFWADTRNWRIESYVEKLISQCFLKTLIFRCGSGGTAG